MKRMGVETVQESTPIFNVYGLLTKVLSLHSPMQQDIKIAYIQAMKK